MSTAPIQVLFDTLLEESKRCIRIGNLTSDEVGSLITAHRDSLALFLHHFAVLNKESYRIATEDKTFASIVYYERVRIRLLYLPTRANNDASNNECVNGLVSYFWEGVPKELSLSLPSFDNIIHANKARDLTSCDIVCERNKFMARVEGCADDEAFSKLNLRDPWHPSHPYFHASVPSKVQAFVMAMRSLYKCIRSAKSNTVFKQCWNVKCNRLFFSDTKYNIRDCFDCARLSVELLDVPFCSPEEHENSALYWRECGCLPWYEDTLTRFCTSSCCMEWKRKLNSVIPAVSNFEPDTILHGQKPSRINNAFELALERNAYFKSELIKIKAKRRACVSRRVFKNEIDSRIQILNTDVALLYWSTIVSRLRQYATDYSLPGLTRDWRSLRINAHRARWISLLATEVYEREGRANLITDVLNSNRLFSTVKSQCMAFDNQSLCK